MTGATESPGRTVGRIDVATARHPISVGRLVMGAVLGVFAAWLIHFVVTSPRLEWDVVGTYLFDGKVLHGLLVTLLLAFTAQGMGTVLGVLFATFRLSSFPPARWVGTVYVTIFRTVPVLLQLIFWFNLAYLFPRISIGVPFGPSFVSWSANDVITPTVAALLGLSLVQGAYMTEIVRAGILSVGQGQHDAARAMGFTPTQKFFRNTLPQAVRVIIPPAGSQFITVVHGSALVSVIAVGDLLFSVQNIYQRTYQIVPLLLVAVIWYLVVVLVLTYFQQRIERHFSRGSTVRVQPKALRAMRGGAL